MELLDPASRQTGGRSPTHAGALFPASEPLLRTEKRVGGSATLTASGQTATLIDLNGDDELTGMVTLSFFLRQAAGTSQISRATAEITWGAGGIFCSAVLDVRHGTMASVPASNLRVEVTNQAAQTVTVGVSVGYFPRTTGNATRTLLQDTTITNGNTVDFLVPEYARLVTVLRSPQTAAMTLRFLGALGATIMYEVRVAASADVLRIPLGGDIDTVRILADGTDITRARLVFDLDL